MDSTVKTNFLITNPVPDFLITFNQHNKVIFTIKPDGNIVFGEGIKPNAAARLFYLELSKLYKTNFQPKEK